MKEIYQEIGSHSAKAMERFSGQLMKPEDINLDEERYSRFLEKYSAELRSALRELMDLWQSKEHRETIGHDNVHISFDLLEYLYLVTQTEMPLSERYITLFGSLLHDLGRYPELLQVERSGAMEHDQPTKIQLHAALSGYLGALIVRQHQTKEDDPEITETSKSFIRRVIGAVVFHGGANEERDPAAHNVQTIDRLAGILGVREFPRNVLTDGVQRGAAIYPDEHLAYDHDFPRFNNLPVTNYQDARDPKGSWTNVLHYVEMPLRNIYPLSSESATKRAEEMRRQSGLILTFMSGGKDSPLYKQVFAPELRPDEDFSFPKRRLPKNIWQAISQGVTPEEALAMGKYRQQGLSDLAEKMFEQQAPDLPETEKGKALKYLADASEGHREDILETLRYVVARRDLDQAKERDFLLECRQSKDQLVSMIASELLETKIFSAED